MLEHEKVYVAGLSVWKQMIVSSAMGARVNESRWDFVVRAFRCLSVAEPSYWPDSLLLKHGLAASDALLNAELASDLLWRAVVNYRTPSRVALGMEPPIDSATPHLSPLYSRPHVPFNDVVKAITICLSANDMASCGKILSCVEKQDMPPGSKRSLYLLSLKGYANAGDSNSAEKLIMSMNEKGLNPG